MKNKFLISGIFATAICCMPIISACGPTETNLSKEEYAKAFTAVSTTLTPSATLLSIQFAEGDFTTETGTFGESIKNMAKFVKNICDSEDFELTNDVIGADVINIDGFGTNVKIKMQLNYDGNIIYNQFLMTDSFETPSFYGYTSFSIKYDFDNDNLVSYVADEYYERGNPNDFTYLKYENSQLKMLLTTSSNYQPALLESKTKADAFVEAEVIKSDYNFTQEYHDAMQP